MTTSNQLKKFIEEGEIMTASLYAKRNDCTSPTARVRMQDWNVAKICSNMEVFIQDSKIYEWFVCNMKGGIITTTKSYAKEEGITDEAARVRLQKWDKVKMGNNRFLYIRKDE